MLHLLSRMYMFICTYYISINVRATNQVLHGQRKGILQIDVGKMLIRMKKMTSHWVKCIKTQSICKDYQTYLIKYTAIFKTIIFIHLTFVWRWVNIQLELWTSWKVIARKYSYTEYITLLWKSTIKPENSLIFKSP